MFPIQEEELITLIPQKMPFVFIGALLEVSDSHAISSFTIADNNILCENGKLTVAGLIENIAQTAAAKTGFECMQQNKKVRIGFIGDVRDFIYSCQPKVGEEITTQVVITNKIFDVTLISGIVKLNGKGIASCKMKIFEEPENNLPKQPA